MTSKSHRYLIYICNAIQIKYILKDYLITLYGKSEEEIHVSVLLSGRWILNREKKSAILLRAITSSNMFPILESGISIVKNYPIAKWIVWLELFQWRPIWCQISQIQLSELKMSKLSMLMNSQPGL